MWFIKRCRLVSLCCGRFPFRFSLSALSFFIFRSSSFHSFSSFFIFESVARDSYLYFFLFSQERVKLWGKCWHSSARCITMPITSSSSAVYHERSSLVYQGEKCWLMWEPVCCWTVPSSSRPSASDACWSLHILAQMLSSSCSTVGAS